MRLRWKFFLILLTFSLAPLLLVAGLSQHGLLKLGRTISQDAEVRLTDIVERELVRSARTSARAVERERIALSFALKALAREAEDFAVEPPPKASFLFFNQDYENLKTSPPDMKQQPGYLKVLPDGSQTPLAVSLNHQVFVLSPDIGREGVAADAARLTRLLPHCRHLLEQFGETVFRVYVTLESGITAVYPGFGGYPTNFEPRRSKWYAQARSSQSEPVWSDLFVSMTTWQMLFTLTIPLYGQHGEFIGAAALDVPLLSFLREEELSTQWSERMRSFLVFPEQDEDGGKGLRILARKDYLQSARLMLGQDLQWLTPPPGDVFPYMIANIENHKSGAAEALYQSQDSIWAYAPVGDNLAFVLIVPKETAMILAKSFREDTLALTRKQWVIVLFAMGVVVFAAAALALIGSRAATRPIMALAAAWENLGRGDFSSRLEMKVNDERDILVQAFNDTVPKLQDHVRLTESMRLAREVQLGLLPQSMPSVPGYKVAGSSEFCDETGGDYLDVYLDETDGRKTLAILVGDVSGHGLPSALIMNMARAHWRALSACGLSLSERVKAANTLLTRDMEKTFRFMTLFCLEVDTIQHRLSYVRAGHEPAFLIDPGSGKVNELSTEGMALGFMESGCFEEKSEEFPPGHMVVLATDGVWEAPNEAGDRFGRERLLEVLKKHSSQDPQAVVQACLDAVRRFRGDSPAKDDMTLAVVKRVV